MLASVAGLPAWLVGGLVLGVVGCVLVAAAFLAADRRWSDEGRPDPERSGESRRRRQFRAYLEEIAEPYREDRTVAGHTVAFHLPERDVAVTFDARAYYALEGTATTGVLVEHETPPAAFGDRLPFETPAADPDDDDAEVPKDAFAELGVAPDATAEAVERAYRRRVKEVHPDQGGDEAAFQRVREAYTRAKRHAGE